MKKSLKIVLSMVLILVVSATLFAAGAPEEGKAKAKPQYTFKC